MLPILTEIVEANEKAFQTATEIRGVVQGSLTVGSYFSISSMIMPEVIRRFQEQFPGIRIEILEGGNREMVAWMDNGLVDCCFCAKLPNSIIYDWIPIFEDEMVVWLPPKHPRAKDTSFPVKDMEKEAFIHTSPERDTDQDRLLKEYNLHMNEKFSTRDGFSTYNMVAAGLGISFNQRLISQNWHSTVAEIPFDPPQIIELGIAVSSLSDTSPATKKFIQCAQETVPKLTNNL